MNLSEALDAALPELPKSRLSSRFAPRLDPDLVIREDILDGMPSISVLQRSSASFARLTPVQWSLIQLFDGARTYEEISELSFEQNGSAFSPDELREFADGIESCGFWYKSPQEKNLAMSEKLAAHRCRRSHGAGMSLAHISFSAWDPDRYLTALDNAVGRFIYNRWFALFAIALFIFEASVFASHWKTFGPDVHLYYQFTEKSFTDLVEFWALFFVLGFVHETAHGLSCKHYGGQVHSMGFLLLYLTPCFYCDITEVWVSATRMQRLIAIIAGIWIELVLCGFATLVWTNTTPGQWQHDFCYKIMLLTGVAVVVLNVNPLLKLDGYYFLTEWIRIPDLKERSTGFVSASVQRYVFRMPVEIPMVSIKQVPLMVVYALASGAYSYIMVFTVLGFAYNVFNHWFAEQAIVPAGIMAFLMFRSRLRTLRKFIMSWYHLHADRGVLRATPVRLLIAAVILVLLFTPIWRDREDAYFLVEPAQTAVIHASVPSKIHAVYVREGQSVAAGQVLARSGSVDVTGEGAASRAELASSHEQLAQAEIAHTGLGEAVSAEEGAERNSLIAHEQQARLQLVAPFAGTVLTSDPESLTNRVVAQGEPLLKIGDTSRLIARVFLPEPEMERIRAGDEVSLRVPAKWGEMRGALGSIQGPANELPTGIIEAQQFAGTKLSSFYTSIVPLGTAFDLKPGMSGRAKVFGVRRSVASRVLASVASLLRMHFW